MPRATSCSSFLDHGVQHSIGVTFVQLGTGRISGAAKEWGEGVRGGKEVHANNPREVADETEVNMCHRVSERSSGHGVGEEGSYRRCGVGQ